MDTITVGLANAARCRPAGSRSMNRAVDRRGGAPGLDRRDPPGPLRDRLRVHSHHRVAVPASGDPGVRARRILSRYPAVGWPPSAPCSRCPPSAPRGHVTPDRTHRMRQSRMPRVPAAATGCRAGVAVCRSGHLSVGVSPDAGPRVPHWPRSSGHARPRPVPCAGVVAVRSACRWPVCRWSVRSRSCGAASPNPGSGALLAAGVTLGVHMSRNVTAGTGPAIRSCAIGDESAVRERCEFSHRPAGPLCSSSSQMTLRGLALCGCS